MISKVFILFALLGFGICSFAQKYEYTCYPQKNNEAFNKKMKLTLNGTTLKLADYYSSSGVFKKDNTGLSDKRFYRYEQISGDQFVGEGYILVHIKDTLLKGGVIQKSGRKGDKMYIDWCTQYCTDSSFLCLQNNE